MTLGEIRTQIDQADEGIREYFLRRMQLTEEIAGIKAASGDDIYKPQREKELIASRSAGVDEKLQPFYKAVLRRILTLSRRWQYERVQELKEENAAPERLREDHAKADGESAERAEAGRKYADCVETAASSYMTVSCFVGADGPSPGMLATMLEDYGCEVISIVKSPSLPENDGYARCTLQAKPPLEENIKSALLCQLRSELSRVTITF